MSGKRKTEFFLESGPKLRLNRSSFRGAVFLLTLMSGEGNEAFVSPCHPSCEIVRRKDHSPLAFHFRDQLGRPNMVLPGRGGDPVVKRTKPLCVICDSAGGIQIDRFEWTHEAPAEP